MPTGYGTTPLSPGADVVRQVLLVDSKPLAITPLSTERSCTVLDMTVSTDDLLTVATQVLVTSPAASMSEVAAAAGISRTTLHSRFPSRQTLLVALAMGAMDLIEAAYVEARMDEGPVTDALGRAVELMIPLGPRVEYLLRESSLKAEPDVVRRHRELDVPLLELVRREQRDQTLRADLPDWWIVAFLAAALFAAWAAVADGRLAPRDAGRLVRDSVLDGVAKP
jgi:AcrR family transcriptional regulator